MISKQESISMPKVTQTVHTQTASSNTQKNKIYQDSPSESYEYFSQLLSPNVLRQILYSVAEKIMPLYMQEDKNERRIKIGQIDYYIPARTQWYYQMKVIEYAQQYLNDPFQSRTNFINTLNLFSNDELIDILNKHAPKNNQEQMIFYDTSYTNEVTCTKSGEFKVRAIQGETELLTLDDLQKKFNKSNTLESLQEQGKQRYNKLVFLECQKYLSIEATRDFRNAIKEAAQEKQRQQKPFEEFKCND